MALYLTRKPHEKIIIGDKYILQLNKIIYNVHAEIEININNQIENYIVEQADNIDLSDRIGINIYSIQPKYVKFGITAPTDISIHREEIQLLTNKR
ncbi:MAG: carbon storage regulator [Candidatus Hodarchaeota archaeon]